MMKILEYERRNSDEHKQELDEIARCRIGSVEHIEDD